MCTLSKFLSCVVMSRSSCCFSRGSHASECRQTVVVVRPVVASTVSGGRNCQARPDAGALRWPRSDEKAGDDLEREVAHSDDPGARAPIAEGSRRSLAAGCRPDPTETRGPRAYSCPNLRLSVSSPVSDPSLAGSGTRFSPDAPRGSKLWQAQLFVGW